MKSLIPAEIICKKRDGEELDGEELRAFVFGVSSGTVSNEQIAALVMAIWFQGLSTAEQGHLTLAIRDSGTTLAWPDLPGPVLDKHSTGGVGDMVSFAAGPMVAACGGFVPMISGRSLGHTGGTLDKLESIPGVEVMPDIDTFQRWVRKTGVAIVGQTEELAPADKRIYAVRDATGTVASIPLIVASILGKKLCEGLDGLVMDVKVGSGAFMGELEAGRTLAAEICEVAGTANLPCTAVLTDMDQPLSRSAGNALEVREVIDYLAGERRHPRFHEVACTIAAEMLVLGHLATDHDEAATRVAAVLDNGAAAEKFAALVAGQGGPTGSLQSLARSLPIAPLSKAVYPAGRGFVRRVDKRVLGMTVVMLGGGRRQASDRVDPSVGLQDLAAVGEEVGTDHPLAVIHAASDADWESASAMVAAAYKLVEEPPGQAMPVILGRYSDVPQAGKEGVDGQNAA